jgi:hypothetical protein
MAPTKMMMERMKYRYETISREGMNAATEMTSMETGDVARVVAIRPVK